MIYRIDKLCEDEITSILKQIDGNPCIILELTSSEEYQTLCSRTYSIYTIKISRKSHPEWKIAIGDCIDFGNRNAKNIILVMTEHEYTHSKLHYCGHNCNDRFLRPGEPSVLIHSTPRDNWEQIKQDRVLKCWNRLKIERLCTEEKPIGNLLGDPTDFSNYIMFGSGVTGEIVVASKQHHKITMDINAEYHPGARLYFDAERMVSDGLILRDGCHLKVENTLPLSPYLLFAATWENIGMESPVSTPKFFTEMADATFSQLYPGKLVQPL